MKQGSSISSHSRFTAFATVTTWVKGASLGSRSRMHQSGCSRLVVRLPHTCSGMVPRLARYRSDSRSSHTKRSEEHTSELQSLAYLVCRLLLEKKKRLAQ